MDEGTSHLDIATERQVTAAVKALRLTRVIIAHRPETIASAPRRLMLCDGELHELQKSLLAVQCGRSQRRRPTSPSASLPKQPEVGQRR
jgi:ATP-binding cassette, subfamily B, bacterial CvaB/MchF/RaxB